MKGVGRNRKNDETLGRIFAEYLSQLTHVGGGQSSKVGSVHNKRDVALEVRQSFGLTVVVVGRKVVEATRSCDSQHAKEAQYRLHLTTVQILAQIDIPFQTRTLRPDARRQRAEWMR